MELNEKKILVGMSGGVDSSTVCMLLKEQGYNVVGVTMRMWDSPRHFVKYSDEQPDFVVEARRLAEKLGFPHHVLDVRDVFKETVVDYFVDEYMNGRTPNPCVRCNREIKWKLMLELADRLGCKYMATGHYARIVTENGNCYVERGKDAMKDQSYFLWDVDTSIWQRAKFPLGEMTKDVTREKAISEGFSSLATQKESMEICFVESDYRDFMRTYYPDRIFSVPAGSYVDLEGKKLGDHEGYPFYTIGQRKGLRIALGTPAYVLKINPKKNTVMIGEKSLLETTEIAVENYRLVNPEDFAEGKEVYTQIRYRSKGVLSSVTIADENLLLVKFQEPVSAATPGQTAAFYRGDLLLGGGVIGDSKALKRAKKMIERQ